MLREARLALGRCHDPGRLADLLTRAERAARPTPGTGDPRFAEGLSDRELAVLRLLQTELTQREMAAQLFVSFNTVKSHTRTVFRKLGVASRAEAVERAREQGLL